MITAEKLGSRLFKEDYQVRYAYVAGAMAKAIGSSDLVIAMGKAGYVGFYGAGGMTLEEIETAIQRIQQGLNRGEPYGINVLANLADLEKENHLIDLLLRYGVRHIEAAAFMQITPALVTFRLKGLHLDASGKVQAANTLMAKVSRPEIAQLFLSPVPASIVSLLLTEGRINEQEAELAGRIAVASDVCVEADSGGHTDMAVTSVVLPRIIRLRDTLQQQYRFQSPVRVGSAGGIGTPESAASAFMLGAEFIVTGSINQCTVQAGTSETVKKMLQSIDVQDTAYAPAGDMFELGSKIQVLKKSVFFPVRANRLYDLWRNNGSLEQLAPTVRKELQDKYFKRSFDDIYQETERYYRKASPAHIEKAERDPKLKMALIFRWYFVHTMRLALEGNHEQRTDYQIHTGPALGAFNRWVKDTPLEDWKNRDVTKMADYLMDACAEYLNKRIASLTTNRMSFTHDHAAVST
uniref:Putative FMN-dependent oxidoreductase n=1 Tax=symbiont bacterium of Paederus fuscipes TaxID=176282 RepID=Q6VT99_UNCXX|nr:putative FMN-dependent oxidoreductase [symbiont bacterium of Paederus fuscipes]